MKKIITIILMTLSFVVNAQMTDSTYLSEIKKIDSTYRSNYVEETLFVPNAFVPNATPIGVRTFKPLGSNLIEYEIWIFDPRGSLVWYSNKLTNGSPSESWDGYVNGELLKSDNYIWKISEVHYDMSNYKGGFLLD